MNDGENIAFACLQKLLRRHVFHLKLRPSTECPVMFRLAAIAAARGQKMRACSRGSLKQPSCSGGISFLEHNEEEKGSMVNLADLSFLAAFLPSIVCQRVICNAAQKGRRVQTLPLRPLLRFRSLPPPLPLQSPFSEGHKLAPRRRSRERSGVLHIFPS